jgi:hypothetical protein
VLALGWAITGLIWWLSQHTGNQPASSTAKQRSARQATKDIKHACARNDPIAAKDALLEWSESRWPQHPPRSLGVLAKHCNTEMQEEIKRLNRSLYGRTSGTWQGVELWKTFQHHRPARTTTETGSGESKLEPLFRL